MIDCGYAPYIHYLSQFRDQWINLLTNEKGPLYIEKLKHIDFLIVYLPIFLIVIWYRQFTHKKIVQRR